MINNRDSVCDWDPSDKATIEVPYSLGEILELKNNTEVLAKICQYRVTVENCSQVINVGLSFDVYGKQAEIDCEITSEELVEKWKKTDKIIVGSLDSETYQISKMSDDFKNIKRRRLTR